MAFILSLDFFMLPAVNNDVSVAPPREAVIGNPESAIENRKRLSCRPREVISFRGRFTEQASQGERILARGRLERVRSEGSEYYRLVVGEGPRDVLRTIW